MIVFSIDEDILRLIDEVDLQKEIKEVGEAILDAERFPQYIREKSATAVSKFLVSYLHLYVLQNFFFELHLIVSLHAQRIICQRCRSP